VRLRSRVARLVGFVAGVSILSMAGYAFTANNTVSNSYAGDGNNTISGYIVTNITWALVNANPPRFNGVQFDILPSTNPPTVVKIKVDNSPTVYPCDPIGGTTWSCGFSSLPVVSLTNLRVVAAQ